LAYIGRVLDRLADDVAAMRQQLNMLNARLERIVERHEAMNREVERFSISPTSPASAGSVRDEFETAPVPLHRPTLLAAICRACEGFLCVACGERSVDLLRADCGDYGVAPAWLKPKLSPKPMAARSVEPPSPSRPPHRSGRLQSNEC
jgi:hypothetical protein